MKREAAWRVFAGEYNDSTVEIKGEGEMTPSYILTPLGAKLNRVFVIGVLTDVENISEGGDLVRAHLSDPTGVFTLYSGSYQKEITDALSNINVPAFIAVVGKVRTYIPEEGVLYVSIRPEKVVEVDANIRDNWILETCQNTKHRIEGIIEAMQMEESNEFELKKLGYSSDLSEGIVAALKSYKNIDLKKYVTLIQESVQFLKPKNDKLPKLDQEEKSIEKEEKKNGQKKQLNAEDQKDEKIETKEAEQNESEDIEKTVLETIKKIEGEDGAPWDKITENCQKDGLDKDSVEEALNSLMDKGLIYEPILGTIKST